MSLFLIIFLIVVGSIAIASIVIVSRGDKKPYFQDKCSSDQDCAAVGSKCIDGKCNAAGSQLCTILPPKECTGDSDCSSCSNFPSFECVTVSDAAPYTFSQSGVVTSIPPSNPGKGWCLPPVTTAAKCSLQSSDPILYKTGDTYTWGCRCKYNFIESPGLGANCDVPSVSCPDGKLFVSDGSTCSQSSDCSGGQCVGGSCYFDWRDSQELDPTQGTCICPSGQVSKSVKKGDQNYNFECVADPCTDGGYTSGGGCKCPAGFIRCPEDVPTNSPLYDFCKNVEPKCVADPCGVAVGAGGERGSWDATNKQCSCPAPLLVRGSKSNPLGSVCYDPCAGKCVGRGTCKVDPSAPDGYTCEKCISPWIQDDTKKCAKRCLESGADAVLAQDCCSGKVDPFSFSCA